MCGMNEDQIRQRNTSRCISSTALLTSGVDDAVPGGGEATALL